MNSGTPLLTTFAQAEDWRRIKYNPLRSLNATSLARMLDNFEYGYLREAAMLFDVIAERDDTIKSVKPKREKEVSQLDWQIMPVKDDINELPEYKAQKEVLEDFWNNVRSVNAYDRNEKGGFGRLVRQMMTSISFRYAVHHIVWRPSAHGLRATFEFVPLWLFENTQGTLRYLEDPFATYGKVLDPDEWMVTAGDGLMISCSIGYFAKRQTYNDWLIFSEKFSMPGVLGRTSAKQGTPEGDMMKQAVISFGHDWNGVLYGDDGSHAEPIQLISADGNPSAMPMPAIIERVDRKFAALYRGADLSSMSSRDGEGTGASLQGEEKEILLKDDAEVINETLERISQRVLEWNFGNQVEPLAKLRLIVPEDEDGAFLLDAATKLADRNVPISESSVLERLSIQRADSDEDRLKPAASVASSQLPVASEENEDAEGVTNSLVDGKRQSVVSTVDGHTLMREAVRRDHLSIARVLEDAFNASSDDERDHLLNELSNKLPQFQSENAGVALDLILQKSYTDGLSEVPSSQFPVPSEEAVNSGTSDGARKGWETRRRNGWTPKNQRKELGEYVERVLSGESREFLPYAEVDANEAAEIDNLTGLDVTGYKHILDSSAVRHILKQHGNHAQEESRGQLAVSKDDFERLAEYISGADAIEYAGKSKHGLDAIRYYKDLDNGTTVVIEEMRTKRKRLAVKTIYKLKKKQWREKE